MKTKIKIAGQKVHEVGYRYFLMSNAIDMGLKGFHARNRTGEKLPEVIALVEGDEETIADFKKLVETLKPEQSQVSSISFEDFEGDVMKTESYAQICSAIQLNKAIPVLLDMRNEIKAVRKNSDMTLDEIKAVRKTTDLTLDEIKAVRKTTDLTLDEIKAVRKTTDLTLDEIKAVRKTTDTTLDEIKGMREDIQPGYGMNLRQVQSDIRAIKERLGMQ